MNMSTDKKLDQLDWVKIREELDQDFVSETIYDKAIRKMRANPLVPIGCVATTLALSFGLFNFIKGNRKAQQRMMRARVGAQAFTIICVVAGYLLLPEKK